MTPSTKQAKALRIMRNRWLTTLDAIFMCGLSSLSQRISDMRKQGYVFKQKTVVTRTGSRVAAYKLVRSPE